MNDRNYSKLTRETMNIREIINEIKHTPYIHMSHKYDESTSQFILVI